MRAATIFTLGLLGFAGPSLVWGIILVGQSRNPSASHDQGHMGLTFILFPLGLLAVLAFGAPALALRAAWRGRFEQERDQVLADSGAFLAAVGLLLALGACFYPGALAGMVTMHR
jgi:hypothetical protein